MKISSRFFLSVLLVIGIIGITFLFRREKNKIDTELTEASLIGSSQSEASSGFKEVSVDEATGYKLIKTVPLSFTFPVDFQPIETEGYLKYLWVDKAEVSKYEADGEHFSPNKGTFKIFLSGNVGYLNGKFTGEDNAEELKSLGFTNIKTHIKTLADHRIMEIYADHPDKPKQPLHMMYIALNNETWVLTVVFVPPKQFNEQDELNWQKFSEGIKALK